MSLPFRRTPVAAALFAAFTVPASFAAGDSPPPATAPGATSDAAPPPAQQLPAVKVESDADNPYKPVPALSSPKYTAPLLDTPQAITVIPGQVIEDQNLLSLRDVLATVPGITFGAGEGGGGYGDSINIRGFTGSSDIALDGIRDSAQYTRSDLFNIERVEVVNGASSVYSGVGSVGGTINLVSKTASRDEFARLGAGIGTDGYGRLSADINQPLGKTSAVRVNAMAHRSDVPGRDVEQLERWGLAPTITVGLGTPTQFTGSYYHQHDHNIPQYGVPFFNGEPLPGVDPSSYFGYRDQDEQNIDTDLLTGMLGHRFDDRLSLRNLTRFGKTSQLSVVDPPQGVFCLDNDTKPVAISSTTPTGYTACVHEQVGTTLPDPAPGFYAPSGPRGNLRDTDNELLSNQTDLIWNFETAGIEHALVTGIAFTHETFALKTGRLYTAQDGAPLVLPPMAISDPDNEFPDTLQKHFTLTGKTDGELDNQAAYVFDNLEFSKSWSLNAGVRYERNEGSSTAYTVPAYVAPPAPPATGVGTVTGASAPAKNDDDLLSYRVGLVFKPLENGSLYVAYGNSKTPSKTSVNGSCTATSTTGTANCNTKPEKALNYEAGTKWGLLDQQLEVTAALFRNERTNFRVSDPGNPDNPGGEQTLDGKSRVDGLELSATGRVTKPLSVFASYTYLKSKLLRGVSKFVAGGGADGLQADFAKGDDLVNVPDHALNLWATYDLPYRLQVGYGLHYEGEIFLTQHSATNVDGSTTEVPLIKADDYVVQRASVSWQAMPGLGLQLNISNLADKEYYARIRNNGWATPGDGRSAVLSVTYEL